jgi:NAD(P)H-nitrite reductase large subunit
MKKIIIIGSSAAGYTLAQRLLAKDSQRSVTIVTQEPFAPYDRRKLLGYFAGAVKEKELFLSLNGKETVRGGLKVTGVNCDRKTLYLNRPCRIAVEGEYPLFASKLSGRSPVSSLHALNIW